MVPTTRLRAQVGFVLGSFSRPRLEAGATIQVEATALANPTRLTVSCLASMPHFTSKSNQTKPNQTKKHARRYSGSLRGKRIQLLLLRSAEGRDRQAGEDTGGCSKEHAPQPLSVNSNTHQHTMPPRVLGPTSGPGVPAALWPRRGARARRCAAEAGP
eukprot:3721413-Rhodomonas_salina.1